MKKTTSWGAVSDWYNDVLNDPDSYQNKVILPGVLRILNLKSGEKVLDLACGQGFFSEEFKKAGVEVVGVDISPELIEIAKKNSPKDISYHVSPADSLPFLADKSIDAISIVLALQNIENIVVVFRECKRMLKQEGRLVLVLNHPVLRVPRRSGWGFDEEKNVQYRRLDGYLSESKEEIEMNPGKKDGIKTVSFHRPLQMYIKTLANTGFAVSRLEEWTSHKQSEPGPRQVAEDRSRKEFPLFLAIECGLK